MIFQGFIRVGAVCPRLQLGDPSKNASIIEDWLGRAEEQHVGILTFPELCLTGYTCADLFHLDALLEGTLDGLRAIVDASRKRFSGVFVIGMPLRIGTSLFNCACVIQQGKMLGLIPKSFLPNYKEYYERRWFSPASDQLPSEMPLLGQKVPLGTDLLFAHDQEDRFVFGVEVCEDLWVPIPPSSRQALAGASLLLNLSASNEVIGKSSYRRQLVVNQSARCVAAYVYCSSGVAESSTDLVFGGHCLISENGVLLAESDRFQDQGNLLLADVDLDRLSHDRLVNRSFADQAEASVPKDAFRHVIFHGKESQPNLPLRREIDSAPFVPKKEAELGDRCREIFHVQVSGLARRLEQLHKPDVAIGISGGLDSTLALLVACKTFDYLKVPRSRIQTVTMPGFGTTRRTRDNALQLIGEAATSPREIDIRPLCFAEMKSLGHRPFGIDLERLTLEEFSDRLVRLPEDRKQDVVFENIQARVRTNLLMNTGFVIGTGDMSELALGWCTYNADHMSMYNPNVSIPKTLVRFLVRWAAQKEFSGRMRDILLDIADTPISPELLPTDRTGSNPQSTESAIGPYELHDFFLFFLLRYGMTPTKILFLASQAQFSQPYTSREIRHWLRVFLRRFVVSQFKRSCLPDGPKVGSVSLSPRGDWRMPSDLSPDFWVKDLADD